MHNIAVGQIWEYESFSVTLRVRIDSINSDSIELVCINCNLSSYRVGCAYTFNRTAFVESDIWKFIENKRVIGELDIYDKLETILNTTPDKVDTQQ